MATIDFSPESPGELVGGSRFKPVSAAGIEIPAAANRQFYRLKP